MIMAMTNQLETLEEQAEKLRYAVKALASSSRSPPQRLATALSYFVRTFRDPPEGEAAAPYGAIYTAIGNPPIGTTLQVTHDGLSADDLETVTVALVDLCDLIVRQCEEVRHLLATAAPQPAAE